MEATLDADVLDPALNSETDTAATATDTTAQADDTQGQQQTIADDKIDGRKFNPEWSRYLKQLREQTAADPENGPKIADMLTKVRDGYARYQEMQQLAPKGLDDVRGWKATVDSIGGAEKAAELLQRAADMEGIEANIAGANLRDLPEEMQKGVYGMVPDALSHLAENDLPTFKKIVTPHFASALVGANMGPHLKEMFTLAQSADGLPALQEKIRQQYAWFMQNTEGAGTLPGTTKSVDPQVARLQQELDNRRKADDEGFVNGVVQATNDHAAKAFSSNADVYIKQLGLTEQQQADLKGSFQTELTAKLGADKAFQKQLAAYKSLKERNSGTVNQFIQSKIDENAKAIIDNLVTVRYGGVRAKPAAKPAAAAPTEGGAVRVTKRPDRSEWDEDKMLALGHADTAAKGIYHLKGGRSVQLVKQ